MKKSKVTIIILLFLGRKTVLLLNRLLGWSLYPQVFPETLILDFLGNRVTSSDSDTFLGSNL